MSIVFMLRGLPASGKSTKRRELLADPVLAPITAVNKDEIRRELGITPGDFAREKEVKEIERNRITEALEGGVNLVIDNTHNSPKYSKHYECLAKQYQYSFKLIDLSNVPLEECLRRDALRPDGVRVGESVIRKMWEQFYA